MPKNSRKSSDRRILKGIGLIALLTFIGKLAGAFKEMVVAYKFGVSGLVDSYIVLYSMVIWIPTIWTSVLASVYIPLIKKIEGRERELFVNQLTGLTLLLGMAVFHCFTFFFPMLIDSIWAEKTEETRGALRHFSTGLAPLCVAMLFSGQFAAMLLEKEKHSNSAFEAIPSLVLALVLLLFPFLGPKNMLSAGTVAGFALQALGLFLLLRHNSIKPSLAFNFSSPGWRTFRNALGIIVFANILMSATVPIDYYLASLLGEGSVSSFGYSQRILLLGMGLVGSALARAVLPVFSSYSNDTYELRRLVYKWALVGGVVGVAGIIVGFVLSPLVVKLLFERGQFTANDTLSVATITKAGLYQLPFYFAGMVLSQFWVSREGFSYLFYSSLTALIVKIVMGVILVSRIGINGLMYSSALMYLSTMLLLLFFFYKPSFKSV